MLSPNVALSLEGRFQYIPQDAKFSRFAAHGAISGLVKLMRYTKQSQLRFFGTVLAGGGEGFRFVVKPGAGITDPNDPLYSVRDFTDTVKAGPLIAGVGGGLYFEASKRASIVAEVHGLAGFPTFASSSTETSRYRSISTARPKARPRAATSPRRRTRSRSRPAPCAASMAARSSAAIARWAPPPRIRSA